MNIMNSFESRAYALVKDMENRKNQVSETETTLEPSINSQSASLQWRNSQYIKQVFQLIELFSDECTFTLSPEGLTLKQMDPSRVTMLILNLYREGCEEFLCNETLAFTVNVANLLKNQLKNMYKDETLRFVIDKNVVRPVLKLELKQKLTRNFTVPLLEDITDELPTPKLKHSFYGRFVLEYLNTLFKDVTDSESVIFTGSPDGLSFQQNRDRETFSVTLEKNDEATLKLEALETEIKSTYSTSYLKPILKLLTPLSSVVGLAYSQDMPMLINVDLEDYGKAEIYLAPRVGE